MPARDPLSNPATAGFTLMEVIVGLAISSVVILAGFAALGVVRDRGAAAEEVNRQALAGATQRATLMDWLASATEEAPTGGEFAGLDGEASGLPRDELLFPTTSRTPVSNVSTTVRLYIDDDPATVEAGLVAEMTSGELTVGPRRVEIEPRASAMTIRYLPEADGSYQWVDGWLGRGEIPRGVEITLEADDETGLPPLLRLPIRVALQSSR